MTPRTPTPRTDAAWKAVSSDPYIDEMFGMDVLAETMESMELEIIEQKKRIEELEAILRGSDFVEEWWKVYAQKL